MPFVEADVKNFFCKIKNGVSYSFTVFHLSNFGTLIYCNISGRKPYRIKVSSLFADKPDSVSLVANTTENTNCSDLMWVNLTCQASDANPPVESYQLLKNGEILVTSNNGTWIRKVSEAGRHAYSCRALHILGNITSSDDVAVTFNGESDWKLIFVWQIE